MGFWSSFFGAGTSHVYNEIKKEEKKIQKWNDNLHITMNYEEEFSNYLKSIESGAVYISEADESVATVRSQIDRYKRKIKEFLNLGGEGKYIYDVEELDEYIEVMKYLKSNDSIDRQEEFLGLDLYFAKDTIEREQEEQELQRESEIAEIVDTDINSLSGVEFEKVCQQLVENMGFETEPTKASGDGGIDLIAYNHQPLLSGKYIIQCKRYSGSVGEPIIRDLYGVVMSERANKGILMTTGTFTKSAINFANGKPIELIDGNKLLELLMNYNIEVVKQDAFLIEMLNTVSINDYENICIQFINNLGYIVKNILERNTKSISLIISDKNKTEDILFVFCQKSQNKDNNLLYNIFNNENIDHIKNVVIVGTQLEKRHFKELKGKQVEILSCEKFFDILKHQGIISNEGINLKSGIVPPDKEIILDDTLAFMQNLYFKNKNEVKAQLSFIEVLSQTIFNIWFENEDEVLLNDLFNMFFEVERGCITENVNIQNMLLYIRANLLCLKGEVDEAIKSYRKLLTWEILTNSLLYKNGLEDMYLAAVYNLYQLLLIKNYDTEARQIYQKHNEIIQYGLDYYETQINCGIECYDEEFVSQWQKIYDTINNGKIGYIYILCDLDSYVLLEIHNSLGYRSMILECFEKNADPKSNNFIGLNVYMDLLDVEQREGLYFIQKDDGMKKWHLSL